MTIGRKVNTPRIARFGATNIQAIRGTPRSRWTMRIGTSNASSAARATAAGSASSGWRSGPTMRKRTTAPAVRLLGRRLHLFIDVRADSLQRVVEGHFASDRLSEARCGRIENRPVELVALDFIRDGRQLRHLGDEGIQCCFG